MGIAIATTLRKIFEDSFKDWVKSLAFGAISAIGLGIAALTTDRLPLEFRQYSYIAVAALVAGLFVTFVFLLFRQKHYPARAFSLLCIVLLSFISYQLIDRGIYKNLRRMDEPFVLVFYPETQNPAQAVVIEREIRNLPNLIGRGGKSVRLEKLPTGFSGAINNTLLGRYLDGNAYAVAYLEIIPDGGSYFLKLTMPLTAPYRNLGFNSLDIETETVLSGAHSSVREDSLRLTAGHHSLGIYASLSARYADIHHGIDEFSVGMGFVSGSRTGKDAFNDSLVNPLGGGFTVREDNLSGAVFFASSYVLGSYYQLLGDPEARCDFIKGYFNYENASMLGSYVGLLSDDDIGRCVAQSGKDMVENVYPHLSANQIGVLKGAIFRNALYGLSSGAANTGKIAAAQLETIKNISRECAASREGIHDRINDACLYNYMAGRKSALMQHPDLWEFLKEELHAAHMSALMNAIYADEIFLYEVASVTSARFRSLDDPGLACELGLEHVLPGSYFRHSAAVGNARDLLELMTDRAALLSEMTGCEELDFFGLDIRKLLLTPEGAGLAAELAGRIDGAVASDVPVRTFLEDFSRHILPLAEFMELAAVEGYFAHIKGAQFNDLSELAAETVLYFLRGFDGSGAELRRLVTGFFSEKIGGVSLDMSLSRLLEMDVLGEENAETSNSRQLTGLLQSYFPDPVTAQLLLTLHTQGRDMIKGPLRNTFLDKMLMYSIVSKNGMDPEQLKDALEQLERKYPEAVREPSYRHYKFMHRLHERNIAQAVPLLKELLPEEAHPKRAFYEYAIDVLQGGRNFRGCARENDYALYLLWHMLGDDFDHKTWAAASRHANGDFKDYLTAINDYLAAYAGVEERETASAFGETVLECGELALAEAASEGGVPP